MKNLFNDPRFVIALSLIALAVLSRTMFLQLNISSTGTTEVPAFVDAYSIDEQFPDYSSERKTYLSQNKVNREQIAWIMNPSRDPFSSKKLKKSIPRLASAMSPALQKPKPARKQDTQNYSAPIDLPVLKALFHDSHDAQAVINGMLLETGDKVSGFKVLVITAEYVVLEKSGSRFTLYPGRS